MKLASRWGLFFAFMATSAFADELPCSRSCPKGTVEVSVGVRAKIEKGAGYINRAFLDATATRKFFSSSRSKEGLSDALPDAGDILGASVAEGLMNVESADDLRNKLIAISNSVDGAGRCLRVKFLGLYTHGNLGMVSFPSGNLTVYSAGSAFARLDCAMADDARVFFGGCNVARGCRGDDFLMSVAQPLLKRGGGRVRGYTFTTVSFFGKTTPRSWDPSNNTQILTVGPKLSSPTWDDGSGDSRSGNRADCLGRITEAEQHLKNMENGMQACQRPNGWHNTELSPEFGDRVRDGIEAARNARELIEEARPYEEARRADRTSFDYEQVVAGQKFYTAFNQYHKVADEYAGIDCSKGCNSGGCHQNSPARKPSIFENCPECFLERRNKLESKELDQFFKAL